MRRSYPNGGKSRTRAGRAHNFLRRQPLLIFLSIKNRVPLCSDFSHKRMPGFSPGSLEHLQLTLTFQSASKTACKLRWKGDLRFTPHEMMKNWSMWVILPGSAIFITVANDNGSHVPDVKTRYCSSKRLSTFLRITQLTSIGIRVGTSVWFEGLHSFYYLMSSCVNFWSGALELFPLTQFRNCVQKFQGNVSNWLLKSLRKCFHTFQFGWWHWQAAMQWGKLYLPKESCWRGFMCRQALQHAWKYPQVMFCLNKTKTKVGIQFNPWKMPMNT